MLRFAEEIMLLLLDDEGGEFLHVSDWSLRCALAGAVLMDLALENRIDTDLKQLVLVDATPVGDDLLDPTLARIAEATETHDAAHWVHQTARHADQIRERALERLIEHGILQRQEESFLWVFKSRRYPAVDGKADREVKLRIMSVLFSDEIPDPRDIVIVCLAEACGIFPGVAVPAGTDARVRAHRAGAQAGPDRAGHLAGRLGYRDVPGDGHAPAHVAAAAGRRAARA